MKRISVFLLIALFAVFSVNAARVQVNNVPATISNLIVNLTSIFTPSTVQVIDAVGDAILANATIVELNPDANHTLTSTPHIADGTEGQIVIIITDPAEANTVTLQDQGTLGGSNVLLLNSIASRAIGAGSSIALRFDGADWKEIWYNGTIDISTDTNLTVTAPITLTGDDVGITVAKDIVAGNGLTGGEDNVLSGADADTTIAVGTGDGVIANADEIEAYGLVASDGTPNDAFFVDADGKPTAGYGLDVTGQFTATTAHIGRTTVPPEKLSVFDGNMEIYDSNDLASESLDEPDFATHASWDDVGDFDSESGNAAYTHSGGTGTLTQTSGNMAISGVGNRWYKFTYTVSSVTETGTLAATITTAFAASAVTLDVDIAATNTVYFQSTASPGNFIISATSDTGGDTFTIDDVTLKEIQGGDAIVNGLITGGGTSGIKVLANGKGGTGTDTPLAQWHVVGGTGATAGIRLQDVVTDATNKDARIKVGHYTNAEEPVSIFNSVAQNGTNFLAIGGGSSAENAMTSLRFYTAANSITTTGTQRMGINSSGELSGDPLDDQFSYMLAGEILQQATTPPLLLTWITPATTEVDLSGEVHNATYNNFATTDQVAKSLGWSLNFFNGGDEYLNVADDAAFSWDDTGANPWSWCGWIEVIDTAAIQTVIAKYDAQNTDREWKIVLDAAEKMELALFDEADDKESTNITDAALSAGWHFVVHTYDSTGGAGALSDANSVWYVDGVAVAESQTNDADYTGMVAGATDVTIGARNTGAGQGNFFQGDMGVIWLEDVELTALQVWLYYINLRGFYNE